MEKKYWESICFSYKKAPYFEKYADVLCYILDKEWLCISGLNIAFITKILSLLNLDIRIIKASDLNVAGTASSLLLNICKQIKATTYISGISGKDYLNIKNFEDAGIKVIFQEFHHPIYKQLHDPFTPCMSVIDLLFNFGNNSLDIIKGVDVPVMDKIFL